MVDAVPPLPRAGEDVMKCAPDALIIGGGPAGAACAAHLACADRRVVLLEREAEPAHKVCGEFLSVEAVRFLDALGIDLEALGAVPIETLRLVTGRRVTEARLPFVGMSLSRHTLDDALLRRAAACGAIVRRGAKVQALQTRDGTWQACLSTGETVAGGTAFLATGKHDLRGWRRPRNCRQDMVAFKQHWRLSRAAAVSLAQSVELFLFDRGYAGLEPVEDGRANLCLLVRCDRLAELGGSWDALLTAIRAELPLLDRRLDGARPCWQPAVAVGAIPFGHLRRDGPPPWRLGDQAAVVPPFTGDGISVALHSARRAAEMFLAGCTADEYHRQLAVDLSPSMQRAMTLSRLLVGSHGQRLLAEAVTLVPRLITWSAAATRLQTEVPRAIPPDNARKTVPGLNRNL